jgi:hypothetical protein
MKPKNLLGLKKGIFTVVEFLPNAKGDGRACWKILCECGNTRIYKSSQVKNNNSCGCQHKTHFNDHTGKKFKDLEFIKLVGKNKFNCWVYEIKCKCSKIFLAEGSDIFQEKIKSCGCRYNSLQQTQAQPFEDRLAKSVFTDYKNKSAKRNVNFLMTYEQFKPKILANCHYCGDPPKNIKRIAHKNRQVLLYNGLDRVDNNKDYTDENTVSSCYLCNQAKHKMTQQEFFDMVKKIYNKQSQREEF